MGAGTSSDAGREIPAYAGMTGLEAGITIVGGEYQFPPPP